MLGFAMLMGGDEAAKQAVKMEDIVIIRDSIEGDKAWVFFRSDESGTEQTMEMLKIDGKWKVNLHMGK